MKCKCCFCGTKFKMEQDKAGIVHVTIMDRISRISTTGLAFFNLCHQCATAFLAWFNSHERDELDLAGHEMLDKIIKEWKEKMKSEISQESEKAEICAKQIRRSAELLGDDLTGISEQLEKLELDGKNFMYFCEGMRRLAKTMTRLRELQAQLQIEESPKVERPTLAKTSQAETLAGKGRL